MPNTEKKRPDLLEEIPLDHARQEGDGVVLVGLGEWDEEIETAYETGRTLIEFDSDERPFKAYKKVGQLNLLQMSSTKDAVLVSEWLGKKKEKVAMPIMKREKPNESDGMGGVCQPFGLLAREPVRQEREDKIE